MVHTLYLYSINLCAQYLKGTNSFVHGKEKISNDKILTEQKLDWKAAYED